MNTLEPASNQIAALHDIELWLRGHESERERLNAAVFGIANRLNVHPHDLAIYILIRTASI
jgi:hypothetical protein